MSKADWKEVTLGEAVEINPKTEKLTPESPFIAMADVDTWGSYAYPSEVKGTRGGIRAQGGDVLMARITPCLENGKIGLVPEQLGAVGGSTEFIVLRDGDNTVPGYAFLLAQSDHVHQSAIHLMVGTSGRQRVSHKDVREIEVSLPPLEVQRQIVAVMQSIDQAISDQETHVKATEKVRENVVESLWEDTGKLFKLKELGKTMTGATPSSKDETNWGSNEIPFVTPGDLSFGGAEITEFCTERFASQSAFDKSTRKIDGYAVAQVCIGSIGKVGYFTGSKLFNQQINIVNGLNLEDARLLAALLSTSKIQNELRSIAGVTVVPIINKTKWSEIEVPWGDEQSRQESSELLAGIDSHLANARHQLDSTRKLRGEVLNALLSGEHEIPADFDPTMRQLNSEEN